MKSPEWIPPSIWTRLIGSTRIREQQLAFSCATGIPLVLVPADSERAGVGSALCVEGCLGERSGAICLEKLNKAEKRALKQARSVQYLCPSGLVRILVPIYFEGRHLGNLLAGPFSLSSLDGEKLSQIVTQLERWGLGSRARQLHVSWRFVPQLTSDKCRAAGTLLQMFARYVEACANQELLKPAPTSSLLQRIEALLAECQDSNVSLKEVAARVNLSPCHFCAVFKKQTGLTFRQYRTRQRLEKARSLLLNPELRVSQIAFQAGFESIPYFNRAFRRSFGCSPSQFRARTGIEIEDKKIEIQA